MTKKFTFNDLQPRVEMLIDALENRGSCASGLPYNPEVKALAKEYKDILVRIRNKQMPLSWLEVELDRLSKVVMEAAGNNQRYRIQQIIEGIGILMRKEIRVNAEVGESEQTVNLSPLAE